MKIERYGRNTLTIIEDKEGLNRVTGSLGADDADSLTRFGRGRMFYAQQWTSAYTYNFLLSKVSEIHPRSLLHLGCGTDNLRRVLETNYVMVDSYTGMDLSLNNLREALHVTNGIKGNYQCRDLSLGLQDMEDDSVDVVIAIELIEHFSDKERGKFLFQEIIRVAKKAAIIATPQVLNGEMRYSDFHLYEFTRDELLEMSAKVRGKFAIQRQYGINIGTKEYEKAIKTEPDWLRHANEYLTPKLLRGVYAAGHPEQANDVLMTFEHE